MQSFLRVCRSQPQQSAICGRQKGVTSVDDLVCMYTKPRQVCHHMNEHDLEDAHIDSAVQGWTTAKKRVSSWKRYNTRRRKRDAAASSSSVDKGRSRGLAFRLTSPQAATSVVESSKLLSWHSCLHTTVSEFSSSMENNGSRNSASR